MGKDDIRITVEIGNRKYGELITGLSDLTDEAVPPIAEELGRHVERCIVLHYTGELPQ